MSATDAPHANRVLHRVTWRRVTQDLPVTFLWAFDTIAALDYEDYFESEQGLLPAGQVLRFSAVTEESCDHVLCDLDDPHFIKLAYLPKGRILRDAVGRATRPQVVLTIVDYQSLTTPAERLSWAGRLIRRLRAFINRERGQAFNDESRA